MNKTVARAVQVLQTLAAAASPMSMADVRRELDLPKSTASEILNTLLELGILAYDTKDRVSLGPGKAFFELSSAFANKNSLLSVARMRLSRLVCDMGESAYLSAPSGGQMMILEKIDCPGKMRGGAYPGELSPMHASAAGKAVLALRSGEEIRDILGAEPFERCTDFTLTGYAALLADLEAARRRRYSLERLERNGHAFAVAAPVRQADNQVIATVSLVGVDSQATERRIAEMGKAVHDAALEISRMMGFAGGELFG